MTQSRRDLSEPTFDDQTFLAILGIIDRTHGNLQNACLLQSDKDERAKPIEWYRGGAQCLLGLRGEIEFERQRRLDEARETPERIIEDNLKTIERVVANWQLSPDACVANWQLSPTPDSDDEL